MPDQPMTIEEAREVAKQYQGWIGRQLSPALDQALATLLAHAKAGDEEVERRMDQMAYMASKGSRIHLAVDDESGLFEMLEMVREDPGDGEIGTLYYEEDHGDRSVGIDGYFHWTIKFDPQVIEAIQKARTALGGTP